VAWISVSRNYAHARARVQTLEQEAPGSGITRLVEALVFAAEDGDREHLAFMKQVVDEFDWSPIKPKTLARNEDYSPGMELAGACVALLKGEAEAASYLDELVTAFRTARRAELKVVARLAAAVTTGEWPGTANWREYPLNRTELYDGILDSQLDDVVAVCHSPYAPLFGETINYLLPLALVGHADGAPGKMLEAISAALGPSASKRGELLYRRSTPLPLRPDVVERHRHVGIIAIDLGKQLHVYHDGFSWHQAKWQFDPDSELARAILELGDDQWADVRDHVAAATWKTIENRRDKAQHILAINPRLVRISEESRKRAEVRFGCSLEVVSFLDT
jgi:hypothetical protein